MKKIGIVFCSVLVVVLTVSSVASATQANTSATTSPSGQAVVIPERAIEVAPHVFYLGHAVDPADGVVVQGYAFVHPTHSKVNPATRNVGKSPKPETNTCFGFLASGAKWKTVENWVVNPTNSFAIDEALVFTVLDNGINKWEDAANGIIGDGVGKNIVGAGVPTTTPLSAEETAPDNMNEVYFGSLEPGTIGVTIIWGVFGGSPRTRELREWDQVYNTYYSWSAEAAGIPDAMDFDSIATHELGHTMGLDDLYTASCSSETMYGYGIEGEIYKRDLNAGDIAGIHTLYR